MRNVSGTSCRENQNTHFMFDNFFSENRTFYGIMSKNMVQREAPQKIWCMRVACCVSKATREKSTPPPPTHTHTHKYAILIAFPQQQSFRERA
jgi:hypothetical protein